ncbi:hypothetical protein RJ640_019944 [Escallonia rubra]|uniref:Uncharacterized protein n=1 Tax=Escallonia rubra TaxID=112253 RepID=A0AA88TZ25_9ASTE|nr:hypothetical protein RJ640_019944 [Escallonia rubra]
MEGVAHFINQEKPDEVSRHIYEFIQKMSGLEHNAHVNQRLDPVGPEQAEVPRDYRPPVMTHQEHLLQPQRIEEPHQVSDDVERRVAGVRRRGVCVAVAPEVGSDGTVAEG